MSIATRESICQSVDDDDKLHPRCRQNMKSYKAIIIIIIIISCHRFSFFPGTSALEPVVNPTTQTSSLTFLMMCDVPIMAVFVGNLLSVVLVLFPDIFVNFCLQLQFLFSFLLYYILICINQ
jgi:hypothetical protein